MKKKIKLIKKYTYEIIFAILSALGLLMGVAYLLNVLKYFFQFILTYFIFIFPVVYLIFLLFFYSFTKHLSFEREGKKIFKISFLVSSVFFSLVYVLVPLLF